MRHAVQGEEGKIGRATSRRRSNNHPAARAAEGFLELLIQADAGGIEDLFAGAPSVDQPLWGAAKSPSELFVMVSRAGGWLAERRASVKHLATTLNDDRAVAEQLLCLVIDQKPIEVPVALAADAGVDGITALRTYHSTWPLTGQHAVRGPLLMRDTSIVAPDVVGVYQRALAGGDLDSIVAAFEDDGYAREPSGGAYLFRGKARLRELYSLLFATGGIPLDHGSLTDDGVRCAIEYTCSRWGKNTVPAQAGIAVYQRSPGGRLAAARIYDDVDPPGP